MLEQVQLKLAYMILQSLNYDYYTQNILYLSVLLVLKLRHCNIYIYTILCSALRWQEPKHVAVNS